MEENTVGLRRVVRFGDLPIKVARKGVSYRPPPGGWPPLSAFLGLKPPAGPIQSHHIDYTQVQSWLARVYGIEHGDVVEMYNPTVPPRGTKVESHRRWVPLGSVIEFKTILNHIDRAVAFQPPDSPLYGMLRFVGINIRPRQRPVPLAVPYTTSAPVRASTSELGSTSNTSAALAGSGLPVTRYNTRHQPSLRMQRRPSSPDRAVVPPVLPTTPRYFAVAPAPGPLRQSQLSPPPYDARPRSSSPLSNVDTATRDTTETETTGADSESNPDDLPPPTVFNLRDLEITHQTPGMMNDMICLLKLPAHDPFTAPIQIHGFRCVTSPYQALGALWLLLRAVLFPDLGGAMLADDAGLGKTVQCLLACLVAHQLLCRADDVERSRSKIPNKAHLPRNATAGSVCPSAREFWLQCPCVPGSLALRLAEAIPRGASLVLVPSALLATWIRAVDKFIAYRPSDRFCLQVDCLCPPEVASSIPNVRSLSRQERRAMIAEPIRQSDGGWVVPAKPNDSRFLLLASRAASYFSKEVASYFTPKPSASKPKINDGRPAEWCIHFGRIIFDESHIITTDDSYFREWIRAREAFAVQPPAYWFLTATPMARGPADLQPMLSLLEKEEWKTASHPLHLLCQEKVQELARDYAKLLLRGSKPGEASEAYETCRREFIGRLEQTLAPVLLRRHAGRSVLGHVIGVPKEQVEEVNLHLVLGEEEQAATDALSALVLKEIRDTLQALRAQPSSSGRVLSDASEPGPIDAVRLLRRRASHLNRLLLAAVLPSLLTTLPADTDVRSLAPPPSPAASTTQRTPRGRNRQPDAALRAVTKGNVKLDALLSILEKARGDEELPGADVLGGQRSRRTSLSKMVVVFTRSEYVANVTAQWLREQLPDTAIELLLPNQPKKEKIRIERLFEEYEGESKPSHPFTVLVATMGMASTGLNMARANYLVLVDVVLDKGLAQQLRGRINRTGQRHTVRIFQLVTQSNPLEWFLYRWQRGDDHDTVLFKDWDEYDPSITY